MGKNGAEDSSSAPYIVGASGGATKAWSFGDNVVFSVATSEEVDKALRAGDPIVQVDKATGKPLDTRYKTTPKFTTPNPDGNHLVVSTLPKDVDIYDGTGTFSHRFRSKYGDSYSLFMRDHVKKAGLGDAVLTYDLKSDTFNVDVIKDGAKKGFNVEDVYPLTKESRHLPAGIALVKHGSRALVVAGAVNSAERIATSTHPKQTASEEVVSYAGGLAAAHAANPYTTSLCRTVNGFAPKKITWVTGPLCRGVGNVGAGIIGGVSAEKLAQGIGEVSLLPEAHAQSAVPAPTGNDGALNLAAGLGGAWLATKRYGGVAVKKVCGLPLISKYRPVNYTCKALTVAGVATGGAAAAEGVVEISAELLPKAYAAERPNKALVSPDTSNTYFTQPKAETRETALVNAQTFLSGENQSQSALIKAGIADTAGQIAKVDDQAPVPPQTDNPPQDFADYHKALANHVEKLESRQRIMEITQAAANTALFFSGVAQLSGNTGLGKFAKGLSSLTSCYSGISQMNLVLKEGVSSLTSVTSLLGGAGLVLTGISLLSSLFADDEEDGLGEALGQIFSAITGMWSEMREGFKETWHKLDAMETNNQERFRQTMAAIEQTQKRLTAIIASSHLAITRRQVSIESRLVGLDKTLRSYLEHVVDAATKKEIRVLSKAKTEEIAANVNQHCSQLASWLCDAATIDARTGRFDPSILEDPVVQQAERLEKLKTVLTKKTDDVPIGFFACLAQAINPGQFPDLAQLKFANLQIWFEMLDAYVYVIQTSMGSLLCETQAIQESYLAEIDELCKIVDDNVMVLDSIANTPALWDKLIDSYQQSFTDYLRFLQDLFERFMREEDRAQGMQLVSRELPPALDKITEQHQRFVAFVRLIDPSYEPRLKPLSVDELRDNTQITFTAESRPETQTLTAPFLQKLSGKLHEGMWREPLTTHWNVVDRPTFDAKLKEAFDRHETREKLLAARSNLAELKQLFCDEHSQTHRAYAKAMTQQAVLDETLDVLSEAADMLIRIGDDPTTAQAMRQDVSALRTEHELTGARLNHAASSVFFKSKKDRTVPEGLSSKKPPTNNLL